MQKSADWSSYARAFDLVEQESPYPAPPPVKPSAPQPPPTWTPWRVTVGRPVFKPPYYGRPFALLNRLVASAYREEINQARLAEEQYRVAVQTCEDRNRSLEVAASEAAARHADAVRRLEVDYLAALARHHAFVESYNGEVECERSRLRSWRDRCADNGSAGLLARTDLAIRTTPLPDYVSRECRTTFDDQSGILIHEHRFPDMSAVQWTKQVALRSGPTWKPANQREIREGVAKLYPALCLRLASEIAQLDRDNILNAIAVNGRAEFTDKATGQIKRAYCASLFATKAQVLSLNLGTLDPSTAFKSLKGIAPPSVEVTPIAPIVRLDTSDTRFVEPKEVLPHLAAGENLAVMDWEDFEHLCRELFERAFAGSGAEVKVTQASRDQGVDAVIFDPDPLRGGKIVVQAKRYTNTVDVSAVRELYGAVINEGATKGILVTTSQYGPDAYSFAKDKPLTLLSGRELLSLLESHGYKFRIDLSEAKRLSAAS